jgi:GTP cyclohydrolase I
MVMRGVQKVQSKTVTSTMLGVFREDLKVAAVFDGEYKLEMLEKEVEKS